MLTAIFLSDQNEAHIVSFKMNNGNYRTICSQSIKNSDKYTTMAADNSFPGTCSKCRQFFDEMHKIDLNKYPAWARSETQCNIIESAKYHNLDLIDDDSTYGNRAKRVWPLLSKLQKKAPKTAGAKKSSRKNIFNE